VLVTKSTSHSASVERGPVPGICLVPRLCQLVLGIAGQLLVMVLQLSFILMVLRMVLLLLLVLLFLRLILRICGLVVTFLVVYIGPVRWTRCVWRLRSGRLLGLSLNIVVCLVVSLHSLVRRLMFRSRRRLLLLSLRLFLLLSRHRRLHRFHRLLHRR